MKLYDGREKFYQYNTNQKLICEDCAVGEEVHFSNSAHGDAAICLTYDLDGVVVVNVPNLYLLSAVELNVYSMRTEDDGRCTISRHVFGVIPRKKPSDYVYEETEVKSYAELDRRIKKLEENAGAGIDLTGAAAGQIPQIAEVGENGAPTKWQPADLPKVEIPPLIVNMTPKNGQWVADRTRSEIVAHVEKGGSVGLAAINNLNAYYWSHNDQHAIFRDVRTATARAYTIYYYIDESGVCTDKTQDYTPPAMTGATAETAGVSGVVPAPAAGDDGKFLRGDGTWGKIDTSDGGIDQDELQAAVNDALEQAKAGLLVFEDSYVDNTANWLTNGYTKVSQTATIGQPSQCTGSDKWGVLFFIAENAANGTGTQMYFPIDGTYKGRIFNRSVTKRTPGEWHLLPTMSDIPTGGGGGGTTDHTLGISGAAVGQIARITAVDGDGVPTKWASSNFPEGGSGGGGEWTKLGDITVSDTYEFNPISFTGGVVTLDTSAEGYSFMNQAQVNVVFHPIDVTSTINPSLYRLKPKDYAAGTFDVYNLDGSAQTSVSMDVTKYKMSVMNIGSVEMSNIPYYDRYKVRFTFPTMVTHGLRSVFGGNVDKLRFDACLNFVRSGGVIMERELFAFPYDQNYMVCRSTIAKGNLYGMSAGETYEAVTIVPYGEGKTHPVNGVVRFVSQACPFVNGSRFELWGANDV